MAVSTKIEPINRDIELMLNETLSPQAQSKIFAEYAAEQIADAKETDRLILGRVPPFKTTVDGREGAPLESVSPSGVIITEFELVFDVLKWIGDQLIAHSPVGSGRDRHPGLYQRSHVLFADGQEVDVGGAIPVASIYTFANSQPYARKIETGSSSQAPDGVYQAVASLAARKFGNIAKVRFTYATFNASVRNRSSRQPAITVAVS